MPDQPQTSLSSLALDWPKRACREVVLYSFSDPDRPGYLGVFVVRRYGPIPVRVR